MDCVDGERRSFKERLGLKVMGCCGGSKWRFGSTTTSLRDEDEDEVVIEEQDPVAATSSTHNPDPGRVNPGPVSTGMNLAAALAAERHIRAEGRGNVGLSPPGTPLRVSLMRLLEEADGGGAVEEEKGKGKIGMEMEMEMGSDTMCCVCMGRKKGAAFIPCGHTFCRVCSRELWLNRGSCPLCNRLILEILDIF